MDKSTEAKIAVLWERSEEMKKFQEETRVAHDLLLKTIHELRGDIHELPEILSGKYVTRTEFKAVKAVFTSVTTLLASVVGLFTFFRN